ncbi:hypothetical protein HWI79_1643 [Cryptosporidium felis]|nr:hypothetical protein HWI79_1643 [Cryptosporidium felis]
MTSKMNKQNSKRVKKCEKNVKKKAMESVKLKRRKGIQIETPNEIDYNAWDELCTALFPSWFRKSRGIILGKRCQESNLWETKTSLHPEIDNYIFKIIEDFFELEIRNEPLTFDLWGKSFKGSNTTETGSIRSNIIWMSDDRSIINLGVTIFENLCAIFFFETGNKVEFSDEKLLNFVALIAKMTINENEFSNNIILKELR